MLLQFQNEAERIEQCLNPQDGLWIMDPVRTDKT